ncbi:S53 family peptidase [Streptomyces orinoci]|uniref:S53 family peptidase n=1 Tax=Streptomyces orinoci TaxID=67339 RepID=A0ABV3JX79_STRON|nr:S53 family peptidase [Streptomyces orinoci]
MRPFHHRPLLVAGVLLLSSLCALPGAASAQPSRAGDPKAPPYARACSRQAGQDRMSCGALIRTDLTVLSEARPKSSPQGLTPRDIRDAYGLRGHRRGRTVAVVVAYHHPRLAADLAVYRAQFHLPPCKPSSGCLRVTDQRGGTAYPRSDAGWAAEEAMDVEAVSAACPGCRILVVEADSDRSADMLAGVDRAVRLGARVVSGSWATPESPEVVRYDRHFRGHRGTAFTFASGDEGYGVQWPAASPYVTAVGGTSLRRAHGKWAETAWSEAGSGCSAFERKPAFQHDPLCPRRTVADVSAVADPMTGLAVYTSYSRGGPGWMVAGGTSLSAPLIAAMYAMARPPGRHDYPNAYPYARQREFHKITGGANGSCGSYLCTALPGHRYNGPTGLGTPRGVRGFQRRGDR